MNHEIQTPSATYNFTVHPADTVFHRLSGIYIFLIIPRHPELVSGSHHENHPSEKFINEEIKQTPQEFPLRRGQGGCKHTAAVTTEMLAEALTAQQKNTPHPAPIIQLYTLLYIGLTNNFNTRLKQHHKIQAAIELGMTHIGILKIASGRKRKKIERDLLKTHNPPLNQTWLKDILQ